MSQISRKLQRLQKFRKLQLILLKTIYELLLQVQYKSQDSFQTLESLKQCENWLNKCLKVLGKNHELAVYRKLVLENHKKDNNFKTYYANVKKIITYYAKDQSTCRIIEYRHQAKNTFTKTFKENIKLLRIATQMLKLFMTEEKHVKNKLNTRKETYLSSINVSQEEALNPKTGSSIDQTESEHDIKMPKSSSLHKRQKGGGKSQIFKKSIFDRRSVFDICPYEDNMKSMACRVINSLFQQKSDPWSIIALSLGNNRRSYEPIERVWNNLILEHNRLLANANTNKISDIKDELKMFYLYQMQMALKSQIGKPQKFEKIKWRKVNQLNSRISFAVKSKTVLDMVELPQNMHRGFYTAQLNKLEDEQMDLSNVYQLYSLIMSQELPSSETGYELIQDYADDPHYYNILFMYISREAEHDQNLLNLFEHNYEGIKFLIFRKKRQDKMVKWSTRTRVPSIGSRLSLLDEEQPEMCMFDEEFFKEQREKWIKYFAEQEKTPTILQLEEGRRQKLLAQSILQANELKRKKLEERQKRLGKRSDTALYTAPRLTNRMRQAIDRIAKKAPKRTRPHPMNKICGPRTDIEVENVSEEDCGPLVAEVILDAASCTSCCSKCQDLDFSPSVPAPRQFFLTHDQIVKLGTGNCRICL